MAEILKEWLTERLHRPIKWDPEEFGQMMKDGHIIANLLLSYHVISEDKCFLIRSSKALEDIKANWKYLSTWLQDIDVHLSDTELITVMEGKGSVLLRLFYLLFLQLDRRDRTDFIKREKKMVSSLVEKVENRFKVNKVKEDVDSTVDDLSKPLMDEKHFIEWQRNKTKHIKQTYDALRHKYKKMAEKIMESQTPLRCTETPEPVKLTSKEKDDIEKFSERHPCKFENYTYDDLIKLEEKVAKRKQTLVDTEWAKNYMENLHIKFHNKSDSEEIQKQMRNALSASLWDKSISEEENKLDTELAKKIMKLSQFEKQMCTQIMETKQQSRNLTKNRIRAENEFNEQRNDQYWQYLESVKDQINLKILEVDYERDRQNHLHRRLYAEKMKRKRQHYYQICYETMLAVVDYASKYAFYKALMMDNEIPEYMIREWKRLFLKHQPIFDILDPMEEVLEGDEIEERSPEEVSLKKLELDRQETLNECDFQEYHNYTGPWTLSILIPKYDPESDERKFEYLGARILGHVIFTLLNIKYPPLPKTKPADLPHFRVKAILRCLFDKSLTIPMQKLLKFQNIHVTRTESAINYCIKKYKDEMIGTDKYVEISYDKLAATSGSLVEENKELFKLVKSEEESPKKDVSIIMLTPNTKQTQTPKAIPEEDITLSLSAELGKYAFEELSSGRVLTDHLLSAMLVEYLRDQDNIKGFVIINYPNKYSQAQILEEIFSGRAPPNESVIDDTDDIYIEESILKYKPKEKDQYKDIRISRLVNDPHKTNVETNYESYFTCYIKLKETQNILKEDVIWNLTKENSELIDRFYSAMGLNYSMYYEVIDKDVLAQMCKYIIGDINHTHKSDDYFFGPNVLSLLDFPSVEDRRYKNKVLKPDINVSSKSRDKLKRTSRIDRRVSSIKKSESNVIETAKLTSATAHEPSVVLPDNNIIQEEVTHNSKSDSIMEVTKIFAGEEDWTYADLPIAEKVGTALASYWEEAEKTYIHDMEELFFANRLLMNSIEPYSRFIKERVEQTLNLPSNKQDIVNAFQKSYNDFDSDFRLVDTCKSEWHCRVKEFQKELYNICDSRKIFAEKQRQAIIHDNWTMEELTSMVNTYISCMQTELNRFYLTYQILQDFYLTMLKRIPPIDKIHPKELNKICRELEDLGKKSVEEKIFKHIKSVFTDLQLKNKVIDRTNNPFNTSVENNVKLALKYIKETNDSYKNLINRENNEIAKIVIPLKKKDDAASPSGSISANPEELLKENMLKCIEEWKMGINGEMFRTNLRILALEYKCYQDMQTFVGSVHKTLVNVQQRINEYYLNEIKSVDRLCKYIQIAIEEARKIPESLFLERDTFVIDPNLLLFDTTPPADISFKDEIVKDVDFKMPQLASLRRQFKICAPTGLCLQQSFIYLLQDFLFYAKESGDQFPYPEMWRRIDPEEIPKLVYIMFGDTVYVDWREFLIYCLNIRFPNVDELLELRKKFRCQDIDGTECINREKFLDIKLWFEQDYDPEDKHAQLRVAKVKNFIFELFETSQDVTNYSAILLAFCKNADPIEGFVMALSMAIGGKICLRQKQCEEVIRQLIADKYYHDACLESAHRFIEHFLAAVIKRVIDITVGTVITELECTFVKSPPGSKKGKKLSPKLKKAASAREAKRSPLAKTKSVQSTSDLKPNTTYICPPCDEEEVQVSEKAENIEAEEEPIKKPEPIESNLVYNVDQAVIWKVLQICLPWHFRIHSDIEKEREIPYVNIVKQAIEFLESDTDDGSIYVFKFVKEPSVCKMLHKVTKFTAFSLNDVLQRLYN